MNKINEPVAWMRRQDGRIIRLTPEKVRETDEPLYIAQNPLSDEEILLIKADLTGTNKGATEAILKFARAIEERHGIK